MRILITGAAGFLGSHLCDRLLADGHDVVGMDNFITGNPENLAHLSSNTHFSFIRHDVSNFIFVPGKLDAVLHFASPASPNPLSRYGYVNLPIQTMKAGALGTHNTLGVARSQEARFLLASTSEIYGDPLEHPQTESYWGHVDPIGTRSVYDEAKRFAEALTMAYHRFHGINTRIVRIFNTYGPRMHLDDGRVVPNFLQQALRKEPLTIYGDGSQTRSFCYMDDLVDGIVRLLYSDEHMPVNIGNPVETTILEFAET
ncbi:MAG: NAD-dependent epimerase/dehydratase family protein, partial [Omnitrophica WOR_2 bacterium]